MKHARKTIGIMVWALVGVTASVPLHAQTPSPKTAVPCDVPYASGGFGLGSREALDATSADYTLKLVFAEKGRAPTWPTSGSRSPTARACPSSRRFRRGHGFLPG